MFPTRTFVCDTTQHYLDGCGERFELAVAVEVLEHVDDPRGLVDAVLRVAGGLAATVPVNLPDRAHVHVWRTDAEVVGALDPDVAHRFGSHWILYWRADA